MEPTSPLSARVGATIAQREMFEQFSSQNKHQLPSVGSPRNSNASWGNMVSPVGKADWGVDGEELVRLRRPEQPVPPEEANMPWLANRAEISKRGEMPGMASGSTNRPDWSNQTDLRDQTVIGAWLEQMQLDQK